MPAVTLPVLQHSIAVEVGHVYAGHDAVLAMPVVSGLTREPIDLNGYSLVWTLRQRSRDGDTILIEKSTVSGGIALGTSDAGTAAGVSNDLVLVTIDAEDTWDENAGEYIVSPGDYVHGLWRMNDGFRKPIVEAPFVLTRGAGGRPV